MQAVVNKTVGAETAESGGSMLSDFLVEHRDQLITNARAMVAQRRVPQPSDHELKYGVPLFLDQLAETLRLEAAHTPACGLPVMKSGAVHHGSDLLAHGFTVGQVVHDYGDICQAVTELAGELGAPITVDEFHTLNRCLDTVTADAVTEYSRQRDVKANGAETERLGFLAHELRNLLGTAMLSFQVLRRGTVGIAGSTGAAHERSLRGMCNLIDRALSEVRLDSKNVRRERFSLSALLEDAAFPAALEAKFRGVELVVAPLDRPLDVEIEGDRQLLDSAVSNLLHNALKFTRQGTRVWLRSLVTEDRVLVEIEDECGGLPEGMADELFHPYAQRAEDRSGLGLGLALSRRAVDQSHGKISVRDLPGKGCVFTIDLPRASPAG